jgi:hypothetical protein
VHIAEEIDLPAANFAALARTAPNPSQTTHAVARPAPQFLQVDYTCHMAAMHWAFMDLGDNGADANVKLKAINVAGCPGCGDPPAPAHVSILHTWYGWRFCRGADRVATRAALYAAVDVGDVVIVGEPRAPAHTMVVVGKSSGPEGQCVYIRGFNNYGTLGTGAFGRYDAADRDINRDDFWHGAAGGPQVFGRAGSTSGPLHVIPYEAYSLRAAIVRANFLGAGHEMPPPAGS